MDLGILRGFELASSLCVNIAINKIIGINVNDKFLQVAYSFLTCYKGTIIFSFIGTHIGVNLRRKEDLNLVLSKMHNRVALWRGKPLSFGGRILFD